MKTDWTKLTNVSFGSGSPLNPDPQTGADERGQKVVLPGSHEVFIDIDNDADHEFMINRIKDMHKLGVNILLIRDDASRSGLPHRHVVLTLDRAVTDVERIALQACLGSDRVREFLSLMRLWAGGVGTTFYENPDWVEG